MADFDIFVSYSRKNGDFVHELVDFLSGKGRKVWVDWEDIPPASEWEKDIYRSIDGAESFVFVISKTSLESEYCGRELRHAAERGKRIVPFAIDGARSHEAPTALRQLNWIWCRETDDHDKARAALVSALDTDLVWARAHTRLLIRAVDWEERADSSLLLRGKDLAEAERVFDENAAKDPRPTELQQRYLHASRSAATRRQRIMLGSVSVALAVSMGLAVLALLQRNSAVRERNSAGSVAFASDSSRQLASHPDVALLLGVEANRLKPSVQAQSSMTSALQAAQSSQAWAMIHNGALVTALAFGPRSRTVAVGGNDGLVHVWDLRAHRELMTPLRSRKGAVASVAFSRDGTMLASGDAKTVQLWNLRTGKQQGGSIPQAEVVTAVAFRPDGKRLASFSANENSGTLWNVRTHKRLGRLEVSTADSIAIEDESFSTDGSTLAVFRQIGTTQKMDLWHIRYGDVARSKQVEAGVTVGSLDDDAIPVLGFNGRTVLVLDANGIARLKAVGAKRTQRQARPGGAASAAVLAVSPDGRTIASGGTDGIVRLTTLATGTATPVRPPHAPVVGRRSRQILRRLDRKGVDTSDAAFNRDGTLVATGWQSSALRLWNQNGTLLHIFHVPGPITVARFSPDGKFLAAGTGEGDRLGPGSVSIWNVHTYKPQGPPIPAASFGMGVEDIAFSRDSRIMAIAAETDSEIGTVRLRDVQTHAPLGAPIRGDMVAFSADGRSLLVGNYDSDTATRVRDILWHDFADLRTRVCNLVWGNLAEEEWATYAPGLPMHETCS